jgi:hypothetical protein
MTDPVTITLKAIVDRGEQAAITQAATLLQRCLSAAAAGPVAVRCQFENSFDAVTASAEPCVVIASLLLEVANYQQPWPTVVDRLSKTYRELASADPTSVFLCTVFRHVPADDFDAQSRLIRIRRLNLLAAELSRETGLSVIDLDRCLADIGAVNLQADYRLQGLQAAGVVSREIALAIVSAGLDAYLPFEVQDTAKALISQTDLGLAASRATVTEAVPSNVLALGSGRRKQVVATVVDTDAESHVGWLFHLLLTRRLSLKEAAIKLGKSIASRGVWASSAMVWAALWQLLFHRPRMGR